MLDRTFLVTNADRDAKFLFITFPPLSSVVGLVRPRAVTAPFMVCVRGRPAICPVRPTYAPYLRLVQVDPASELQMPADLMQEGVCPPAPVSGGSACGANHQYRIFAKPRFLLRDR
jgi:hypothetical protein